ncbi:MAG: NUDIX hydrolase [Leucobacter sp.]
MQYQRASVAERRYLPPAVAVSVVAFALRPPVEAERGSFAQPGSSAEHGSGASPTIWLPLVRRTRAPFLGDWALPGGPTEWDETLADTALRTLRAAARRDPRHLEQLYSFGGVERSAEAQRLVTIAYWAQYGEGELDAEPVAGSAGGNSARGADLNRDPDPDPAESLAPARRPRRWDDPLPPLSSREGGDAGAAETAEALEQPAGENVAWFSIDALPQLAFDHAEIIAHAVDRLRAKTEYAAVAHRFLDEAFTLGQLRAVTEAVLGQTVDPANFRRQALARGGLIDTGELDSGGAHRPARLYRFSEPDPGAGVPAPRPQTTERNARTIS